MPGKGAAGCSRAFFSYLWLPGRSTVGLFLKRRLARFAVFPIFFKKKSADLALVI